MPLDAIAGQLTYWTQTGAGIRRALFLHCALAHSGAWKGVQAQLDTKLRMRAFDMPGHGRSGDWDRSDDLQDVTTAVAAALIDRRADLVGHSFGATVALRLARDHPEKVRSLTLIEPVLFAAARDRREYREHVERMKPFFTALEAGDREGPARFFNSVWGTGAAWEDLPEAQRAAMTSRIGLISDGARVTEEDGHGQAAPGALEAIRQPVLLIEGSASPAIARAVHDVLAARLPDVRRVVVAGAGHMVPITHPQAVAGEIAAFLKL